MASDPPAADRIGLVLDDRYRIDAPIAAGGMGVVYLAERIGIGKRVAIKFLHEHAAADQTSLKRFEREAEAMSRVTHPHLASVIDHGIDGNTPYLVMDYHPGETLADLLDRGAVPAWRAVVIAKQIASAIGGVHAAGIVHRDLKPDNVVLLAGLDHDFVKILDFGIAKISEPREGEADMTAIGHAVGTPSYMSPEQAYGGQLDARADLYALGVILYEMVCGTRPFVTEEKLALLRMHVEDPPPAPRSTAAGHAISGALEAVILRLLAKRPDDRYGSAAELSAALSEVPEATAPSASREVALPSRASARAEQATVVDTPSVPQRIVRETSDRTEDVRTFQRRQERRRGMSWGWGFLFLLVGLAGGFVLRDPRILNQARGLVGMPVPVDAGVRVPLDAGIDAAPRDAPIDARPDAAVDAAVDAPVLRDAAEPTDAGPSDAATPDAR